MSKKNENKLVKIQFIGLSPHDIPGHGEVLPETILSVPEDEATFLLKGLFKKV